MWQAYLQGQALLELSHKHKKVRWEKVFLYLSMKSLFIDLDFHSLAQCLLNLWSSYKFLKTKKATPRILHALFLNTQEIAKYLQKSCETTYEHDFIDTWVNNVIYSQKVIKYQKTIIPYNLYFFYLILSVNDSSIPTYNDT